MRTITIEPNYLKDPPGSVLISVGNTKVLCVATVEDRVPRFRYGSGKGWLTAEYSLLPGSTNVRTKRERGHTGGRTSEIQRLIGRTLRTGVDLSSIGERTIWVDCDVIQADGGTRCASITGGFVALALAIKKLCKTGKIRRNPLKRYVGAVSVGLVKGEVKGDLDYELDFNADVDMNVVMDHKGNYIEIQGTAEGDPFTNEHLHEMMVVAGNNIEKLIEVQKEVVDIFKL